MVLSMDRWVGKVAIVTGASSGIGAAISEQLVKEGLQVVGLARRQERIEEQSKKLAGGKGKLHAIKADISKEDDVLKAFRWVKENLGPIHILINNAGIVQFTSLSDGDTELWKKVLDLNVIGLCIATREAVRDMKKNNINGHIVHINSIAGHKVPNIPSFNIYPASKFAVTALAETLRLELNNAKSKIKITSISPGATETEFIESSNINPADDGQLSKAFKTVLKSEDVADAIIYALSTPPHVQIQELTIKPINEEF
ncbi:hypothetical protein NQ314_017852 [Rhamnusium bicolor]|uniref:Farnesol dehydrogenase-like n=1 Tax=Rhamnusium bicolor TaxID=1586634 RepID=A0AAV8WTF9_9CUCU|nr:hypothetical protein NQ314_017852 [Rhamnusium bicolor]